MNLCPANDPASWCRAIIDTMPDAVKIVGILYVLFALGLAAWCVFENWLERRARGRNKEA